MADAQPTDGFYDPFPPSPPADPRGFDRGFHGDGHAPSILPPDAYVDGKTIAQWTVDWWKWAAVQHTGSDAFTDTTGAYAGTGQQGHIFFLAGVAGNSSTGQALTDATRQFSVPGNDYLLVPLLNFINSQSTSPGETDAQLKSDNNGYVAMISNLHLTVDGKSAPSSTLMQLRESSPEFHTSFASDNPFGSPAGPTGDAFADGYYAMLKPLGAGTHTIGFGGTFGGTFTTSVTDTITALPSHCG